MVDNRYVLSPNGNDLSNHVPVAGTYYKYRFGVLYYYTGSLGTIVWTRINA